MENQNNNHNQNSNGFLLGLIIGGVATLLFTTKKGREIVKDLTEQGIERISDFQDKMEKVVVDYEDVPGEDYVEPEKRSAEIPEPEKPKLLAKEPMASAIPAKSEKAHKEKEVPSSQKTQRTVRRFFRKKS